MSEPEKVQNMTASSVNASPAMELIRPDQLWEQIDQVQQQKLYQVMVRICWQMVIGPPRSRPQEVRHEDW